MAETVTRMKRGRKLENKLFCEQGEAYQFRVYEGFESQQRQNVTYLDNTSQHCTGTEVLTSDNDYSYRLHCNSTQEPQSQLKASLYWPLSKERKRTVPAPADLWGKKKETSRYIRAQGNNSIVFLNML